MRKKKDAIKNSFHSELLLALLFATYHQMGNNLENILNLDCVDFNYIQSDGAVENATLLLNKKCCQVGIVQKDIWDELLLVDKNYAEYLRVLHPLHIETFHVITRRSILDWKELKGTNIYAGKKGSGSLLTAQKLLGNTLDLQPSELGLKRAVDIFKKGDLDAIMFVSGAPVEAFRKLNDDFHLLEIDFPNDPNIKKLYEPVTIVGVDDPNVPNEALYEWQSKTIKAVGVRALLVTYDWNENLRKTNFKMYCKGVNLISDRIDASLGDLQNKSHIQIKIDIKGNNKIYSLADIKDDIHVAWRTVDSTSEIEPWKHYRTSSCEEK